MVKFLFLICCFAFAAHAQSALPAPDTPPSSSTGASTTAAEDPSAAKARAALNAMIEALGGERWLNLENSYTEGRIAAFYQGKPTGETILYWDWRTPIVERIDLTEKKHDKHDWIQIFSGNQCWEITYRGKHTIASDQCGAAIRRRDHSVDAAVRVWMKQPSTILMYDGQSLAARHLAEQVTLLNAENDAITIQMDAQTHLPLRCSWSWRDPVYHDKDQDVEEYDDYHNIEGLPTPFTISRFHNGDETQQRFVMKADYNVPLPMDWFDVDAAAARYEKKKQE